jgi:hypothetical protein
MNDDSVVNRPVAVEETEPKKKKGFLRFPKTWKEVRKLGWKFMLAFILFYLVRDTILYILIPYLIAKGFFF